MSAAVTVPAPTAELEEKSVERREAFERNRTRRVVRLAEYTAKAMSLAARYACEDEIGSSDDPRVCGCIRQAREYLAQIDRLRAMTYADADVVLAVTLSEDLEES